MKSVKESGFDPAEDLRQVSLRLEVIRYLAIVIVVLLLGRLWYLQVMNSEVYAERSDKNRTRILPIPARRGTIFDRKGRILVTSQPSYNIVLSRKDIKEKDFSQIADLLVKNLGIEQKWLANRFEAARHEAKYEFIVVKELATAADVAWVRAHQYEYPMIRAEEAPQRLYQFGTLAAHALGYVGEVSPEDLKRKDGPFSYEKGYKLGDIIGKAGIERSHNDILMGKDGELRVLVDSRGRIQKVLDTVPPVPGRDFYSTLDLDIQKVTEQQTDSMPSGRGSITVADPNNGEVLAMASRPVFDPNLFSQRAKTPEGKDEIRDLQTDEDKPLFNRAIQGQFPPGSTWKLLTTVAALNEGVITPTNNRVQDGSIQIGNYLMKSISNYGAPDVVTAIAKSADGYYYRLGLKMGVDRFEKWVNLFRFGQRTGIDLPGEYKGIAPTRETKKGSWANKIKKAQQALDEAPANEKAAKEFQLRQYQRESEWTDYDMASSAFGQGQNASVPIQLLRYVSGLAVGGQMYTPHLMLRVVAGVDRFGNQQPEMIYEDANKFSVPMSKEIHDIVLKGMNGAVEYGTAGAAKVEGFDVCAKTGTAQVASTDRVGSKNKDHAWLISFAPRDKPELAMVILTENVGFGGTHSAPRAKPIYEDYYRRTRNLPAEPLAQASPTPEAGKVAAAAKDKSNRSSGTGVR
ncbi:MAG TPA: penicillin-binding protein 2 [Blastocatellia bacterium]|nr:penicillin-binding protein 2 [Blastocatellia bacterium]